MNPDIIFERFKDWVTSNFIMTEKVYEELEYVDNVFKYTKVLCKMEYFDIEEQFIVGVAATVHDIAKFYQIQKYDCFEGDFMYDHATKGAELLQNELLRKLIPATRRYDKVISNVVRLHDMENLPTINVGKKSIKFAKLLQDAIRIVILENSITRFDTYFSKVQWGESRFLNPTIKDWFRIKEPIYIVQPSSKIDLLAIRLKFILKCEYRSSLIIIQENDCINRLTKFFLEQNYYEASEIVWLRKNATDILTIRKEELD